MERCRVQQTCKLQGQPPLVKGHGVSLCFPVSLRLVLIHAPALRSLIKRDEGALCPLLL